MFDTFYFAGFILSTLLLIFLDKSIGDKVQGKYYLIHSLVNFFIVIFTFSDVLNIYYDFDNSTTQNINYFPTMITYALHFYHVILYYKKLRKDDWIHHILMVTVALPIGCLTKSGSFLNHSLFFLTGLPGMIDYLLLFLVRNNCINKLTEKKINKQLNLWIRNPGCIAHSCLTILAFFKFYDNYSQLQRIMIILSAILVYWNGIYFMEQVVSDYQKNIDNIKYKKLKNKVSL